MEQTNFQLHDILAIIKRRKLSLLVTFISVSSFFSVIALILPPVYKSYSTILIEDQEIPVQYVQSTVTSFVEKRLQEIKQRIMSTARLQEIIDQYNLYEDMIDYKTKEQIVEIMRRDISLDLISAEVIDQRTGRNMNATVAFTLSYAGKNDPAKVQRVASVLTSLFLEENIKVRQRQVSETSDFFQGEKDKIEQQINTLETQIAAYKEQHINELPELMQVNVQELHTAESNRERVYEQLRGLKEKEASLLMQISLVSPQIAEQEHLSNLRQELSRLSTIYTDRYPDIVRIKNEIDKIEKNLSNKESAIDKAGSGERATNPAFINLSSQLSSVRSEISSAKEQIANYEKQAKKLRGYIKASPVVEQEYRGLQMERDNLKRKYDDLMQKFMEARVAQGLERNQKGERFTLIDPALRPERPFKPNRLAIFLIGIVLGLGSSVGLVAVIELNDDTIRDPKTLAAETNVPILTVVPVLYNEHDRTWKQRKWRLKYQFVIFLLITVPIGLHFFVIDLEIVWLKILRTLRF